MLKNLLFIVLTFVCVTGRGEVNLDSILPVREKLILSLVEDCKISNPKLEEKAVKKQMEKAVDDALCFYNEFFSAFDINIDPQTGEILNFYLDGIKVDSLPYERQLLSGIIFHYNNNTAFISALLSSYYMERMGLKTNLAAGGKSVFLMREMVLLMLVNTYPKSFAFNYELSRHYYDKGVDIITDVDFLNDPLEKLLQKEEQATALFIKAEPYFQKTYSILPAKALNLFDQNSIIWGGPPKK